jgi:hypothetical protein
MRKCKECKNPYGNNISNHIECLNKAYSDLKLFNELTNNIMPAHRGFKINRDNDDDNFDTIMVGFTIVLLIVLALMMIFN